MTTSAPPTAPRHITPTPLVFADKAQWLKLRQEGITSTDIAAIIGVHPYKTPHQVWRDKKYGDSFEGNDATEIGTALEPYCKDRYIKRTGAVVDAHNALYKHYKHSCVMASIDYRIINDPRGQGLLECKSVSTFARKAWGDTDTPTLPKHYYAQGMHQLAVTGYDFVDFAIVTRDSGKMEYYTVMRNEEAINSIVSDTIAWWTKYIVGNEEPPRNADEWSQAETNVGTAIAATATQHADYLELVDVKARIKELERIEKTLTDKLKVYTANNEVLKWGEEVLATFKSSARRTVKVADVIERFGDDALPLISTTMTRTFAVKGG